MKRRRDTATLDLFMLPGAPRPAALPHRPLIVDSFAGGGGASEGIRLALGRGPDIAINHDREAIALHAANHPDARHYAEDVWNVDPVKACQGRPVRLMWLSPDCKHFSKAKGGKPRNKKVRGLAWVATRWAKAVKPDVIVLENVEEFKTWGPLLPDGMPDPSKIGHTFQRFVRRLERLGYDVQWRELRACDYGAPTIRKRLFLVARCDGEAIAWPIPTHGKGRPHPWRTAAECIDFSLPCPSIFARKKPLADATLRRIARGIQRFVIDAPQPFIVGVGGRQGQSPERPLTQPYQTITSKNDSAIVSPFMVPRYGEREGQDPRTRDTRAPMPTIVPTQNGASLVAAFLAKHYGGHETPGTPLPRPISTLTTQDHHHLVTSALIRYQGERREGERRGASLDDPLPTIPTANRFAEVRAFLMAYYGTQQRPDLRNPLPTIVSKDRFGLVTVHGAEYVIADIGMRMLEPRELYRAQGFSDAYRIDVQHDGKPLSKTAQVRMVGNSVCPPLAAAIIRANLRDTATAIEAA
jgi:DNA (cytosine-5)-methyltransferase 1